MHGKGGNSFGQWRTQKDRGNSEKRRHWEQREALHLERERGQVVRNQEEVMSRRLPIRHAKEANEPTSPLVFPVGT